MNRNLIEMNDYFSFLLEQSLTAATTSAYVDMTEYGSAAFACVAQASNYNVVCQVMQATTTAGAGAKTCTNGPQSGTVTLTGDGSTLQGDVIEVTDRDLDVAGGFKAVAIRMTPTGTVNGGCVLTRGHCRHARASMLS